MNNLKLLVLFASTLSPILCSCDDCKWDEDAALIEVYSDDFKDTYNKTDLYCLEYKKQGFRSIDIRFKVNETDPCTVKIYRNITYVITINK